MARSVQRAISLGLAVSILASVAAGANPLISPGDLSLRQDIQLLADRGIIEGPVTSWPLSWAAILSDIDRSEPDGKLSDQVTPALARVRARAEREAQAGELRFNARASAAENPVRARSFADTPRESGEIGAGLSWTGDRLSVTLNGQAVASPDDGKNYRADGSMLGVVFGNYTIAASTLDRWWGPGWDGSLILSNNARPIPALAIERNLTDAFDSQWLGWLGAWDLSVLFGQMENDRDVPEPRFFGMRFNFRPLPSLEIGLSRTAQWCGEGRPCGFDTFTDLLLGRDNRGDGGVDLDNEPGNQLAGVDLRWNASALGLPFAIYGQLIGEDEAGGFPSRHIGQAGIESSGTWMGRSYRLFGEYAATTCGFYKSDEIPNCAYNHAIYRTGYRYRGRTVGHGADNDSSMLSAGILLLETNGNSWSAILRRGELNRGGPADAENPLTATPQDILELQVSHRRFFRYGQIEIGAGVERIDDIADAQRDTEGKVYLQWRSSY
ncbi:MAG: capsule assembly Wzi family protein [Woeseia sp.]